MIKRKKKHRRSDYFLRAYLVIDGKWGERVKKMTLCKNSKFNILMHWHLLSIQRNSNKAIKMQ
jgi:hypothetical protein